MATIYDVEGNKLIESAAKELAKDIKAPEWAAFVKTGMAQDRVPAREDWWQVRAASILRTLYKARGPLGTQKLRTKYGSRKNRGHKPERFYRASGKIIRVMLQQLEKAGYIIQKDVAGHKGRIITGKGKSFLDKLATSLK